MQPMDRRGFAMQLSGAALSAKNLIVGSGDLSRPAQATRDDKQYEICKQRGHKAIIPTVVAVAAVYVEQNPKTPDMPGYFNEGDWNTCAFCGRSYRLVTRMEER